MHSDSNSKTDSVKLVFHGLTREQAKTLAHWYEGQGEQQQAEWFIIHGVKYPLTDVSRKGGFMGETTSEVSVYLKTP